MKMRIILDCTSCDNDISVPFVDGERTSQTKKRIADHVLSKGWQPMHIGKTMVGYCCAACCLNFGVEEETNDRPQNVVSIRA